MVVRVLGNVMQVSSKYTAEELMKVERYAPKALTLYDATGAAEFSMCIDIDGVATQHDTYDDGKIRAEFCMCAPSGGITDKAIIFDSIANDGKASVMVAIPDATDDVKLYIADTFGKILSNIETIEDQIKAVLDFADTAERGIINLIEVIDSTGDVA